MDSFEGLLLIYVIELLPFLVIASSSHQKSNSYPVLINIPPENFQKYHVRTHAIPSANLKN